MTEGEVCLDRAKMAETQRQTQLDRASAVKKAPFKRKRNLWLQDEGRLAIIGAVFKIHLGNVGFHQNAMFFIKTMFLLAGVLAVTGASTAVAKDWRSYTSASEFPAFVKSISGFPSAIDDSGKCTRWGRWRVCVGAQPPKATLTQCGGGVCPNITIHPFECSNPAAGTFGCSMNLIKDDFRGEEDCSIWIPWDPAAALPQQIGISCPTDLVLK
ncbi:MAG: hypothetical protein O3B76_01965 [Proteobacteria bacterium]|nr:hypothetical protein [Pseudomonadota bacterium]MDA1023026.1 hypothetical protein [Pseudomonadota bacterium]